ncbi:Mu transposase C-terminal domain-containing protein [Streptosporangium sp. NBC_01639]|uniref:Mu transposase C-terminal domain-containing protein n=1 Tax=Streptosporangium sp. NBC_01639 TaxID=2975948 RepID=UPI003867ACCA|nr:Mu transposase C-terminal domain-containing protein [Streptosporangium sp. NBC_01639]
MHRRQAPQGSHRRHPVPRPALQDPVLADYVGEQVTIRYDPRDITEIRVYLRQPDGTDGTFLCRAICPELSGETIGLKEITAARNARRKHLRGQLTTRSTVVDTLLALHNEPLPAAYPATTALRRWTTPDQVAPASNPLNEGDTPTPGDGPRLKRYPPAPTPAGTNSPRTSMGMDRPLRPRPTTSWPSAPSCTPPRCTARRTNSTRRSPCCVAGSVAPSTGVM